MGAPDTGEPEPIGPSLGLSRNFAPAAPWSVQFRRLQAPDGTRIHVLKLDTVLGTVGVTLDDAGLEELIRQAQEAKSGLTLPAKPKLTKRTNG